MSRKFYFLLVDKTSKQTRISVEKQCHSSVLHSGWHTVLVGVKYSIRFLQGEESLYLCLLCFRLLWSLHCYRPEGIQFSLGEGDVENHILSSICEKNKFSELLFCTLVPPAVCGSGSGCPGGPWWLGRGKRHNHADSRLYDPIPLVSVGNEATNCLYGVCVCSWAAPCNRSSKSSNL